MSTKEVQLRIDRARWWAIREQPFYGQLAMNLADDFGGVGTAATDGRRIIWDERFVESLTDEQLRFVLLHETLHCAHGHPWRFPHPDRLTNAACDCAINLLLTSIKGIQMPDGGYAEARFKDMAEEEILLALRREQSPAMSSNGEGQQQQAGQGKGGDGQKSQSANQDDSVSGSSGDQDAGGSEYKDVCGGFTKGDESAEEQRALQEHWERAVVQAAQAAKGCGQDTSGSERLIERVLADRIDWRRETADFVRQVISERNDWSRSARRHAWQPVIYPRKRQDDLGLVAVARDTSGSIADDVLAVFTAHIQDIAAELGCDVLVFDCDCRIHREIRVRPGDEIPPVAAGGGGTDFRPVFERLDQLVEDGERVAGLIYLTDLDGDQPETAPDYPVLWICTTGRVGRVGRTVRI